MVRSSCAFSSPCELQGGPACPALQVGVSALRVSEPGTSFETNDATVEQTCPPWNVGRATCYRRPPEDPKPPRSRSLAPYTMTLANLILVCEKEVSQELEL